MLTLSLWTHEIPSEEIIVNKIGNRAIGGQNEINILDGFAKFKSV